MAATGSTRREAMSDYPTCPDCDVRMEGGFILDRTDSGSKPTTWVEGAPDKTFWGTMKVKDRRQMTVYAWRCPTCALLRMYAAPDEDA